MNYWTIWLLLLVAFNFALATYGVWWSKTPGSSTVSLVASHVYLAAFLVVMALR